MEEKTGKNSFEITLADGSQLKQLELNGNNFLSKNKVTAETFRGKLAHVVIAGDAEVDTEGLIGEHDHMELVQIAHYTQASHGLADGWYFVLRDMPRDKLEALQTRGDIDYMAMMLDVEL